MLGEEELPYSPTTTESVGDQLSRRKVLQAAGIGGIAGFAGCFDMFGGSDTVITHIYIIVEEAQTDGQVDAKIALAGEIEGDSIDEIDLSDLVSVHSNGDTTNDGGAKVVTEDVTLDFHSDDIEGTVAEGINKDTKFSPKFEPDRNFHNIHFNNCEFGDREDQPDPNFMNEDLQHFADVELYKKPRFPDGKEIGPEIKRVESGNIITGRILEVGELNNQGGIELAEIKINSKLIGNCPVRSFIRMSDGFLYEFIDDVPLTESGYLYRSDQSNNHILRCESENSRRLNSLGGLEHYPSKELAELKGYAIRKDTGLQYIHLLALSIDEDMKDIRKVDYSNVLEDASDFGLAAVNLGLTLHSSLYFGPRNAHQLFFHLFSKATTEALSETFNNGKSTVEQYYTAREDFLNGMDAFDDTKFATTFLYFNIARNVDMGKTGIIIEDLIADVRKEKDILNKLVATPSSEHSILSSQISELNTLFDDQRDDLDFQMFDLDNSGNTIGANPNCDDEEEQSELNQMYVLFNQMSAHLRIFDIYSWLGGQWTAEYSVDKGEKQRYPSEWDEVDSISVEGEQSGAALEVSDNSLVYEDPEGSTIHVFLRNDQEHRGEIPIRGSWGVFEGEIAAVCPIDTSDSWNRQVCVFDVDDELTEVWSDTEVYGVDIAVKNNVYAVDHQNNTWNRFSQYEWESGDRLIEQEYEPRTENDIAVPGSSISEWTGPVIPGNGSAVFFGAADSRSRTIGHIIDPDTGEQQTTFEYTEGELLPGETGVFEVSNDEIAFTSSNGEQETLLTGDDTPNRVTTIKDHLIYVKERGTLHSISSTGSEFGPVDSFDEIDITQVLTIADPVTESDRQTIVVLADSGGWYVIEIDAELSPISILGAGVLQEGSNQSSTHPSAVAHADQICLAIFDEETVTIYQGEETDRNGE